MQLIPPYTFGSTLSAPRADATTNYVDWWAVRAGTQTLLSLFGYNSGAQQYIQVFDAEAGPTVAITDTDATTDIFTAANHGLSTGQRVEVDGITGITDGTLAYVNKVDANNFKLYDTLANSLVGGATGRLNPTSAGDTGTISLLPLHTFAIGATDNYSCIVPVSGVGFGKGVVVAVSTTAPRYTAGAKEVTMCGTLIG